MTISNLPQRIAVAVQPLLDALPPDQAMARLVVERTSQGALVELAGELVRQPALSQRLPLCAGLWLYVDQLDRSHRASQQIAGATGSFWHGIMHRREGDFSNSHYWFRRTGRHPAMDEIDGYDGHRFIDEVAMAHRSGADPPALVDCQRREWAALFAWCATNA